VLIGSRRPRRSSSKSRLRMGHARRAYRPSCANADMLTGLPKNGDHHVGEISVVRSTSRATQIIEAIKSTLDKTRQLRRPKSWTALVAARWQERSSGPRRAAAPRDADACSTSREPAHVHVAVGSGRKARGVRAITARTAHAPAPQTASPVLGTLGQGIGPDPAGRRVTIRTWVSRPTACGGARARSVRRSQIRPLIRTGSGTRWSGGSCSSS